MLVFASASVSSVLWSSSTFSPSDHSWERGGTNKFLTKFTWRKSLQGLTDWIAHGPTLRKFLFQSFKCLFLPIGSSRIICAPPKNVYFKACLIQSCLLFLPIGSWSSTTIWIRSNFNPMWRTGRKSWDAQTVCYSCVESAVVYFRKDKDNYKGNYKGKLDILNIHINISKKDNIYTQSYKKLRMKCGHSWWQKALGTIENICNSVPAHFHSHYFGGLLRDCKL